MNGVFAGKANTPLFLYSRLAVKGKISVDFLVYSFYPKFNSVVIVRNLKNILDHTKTLALIKFQRVRQLKFYKELIVALISNYNFV
jgi:hypothetical protein